MRIGIIGTGLVGGSLLRALRGKADLRAWDALPGVRAAAREEGFLPAPPEEMARWADLCVVATPPEETAAVAGQLLQDGAGAVLDTASVKERVSQEVAPPLFLGGHPLAGSERSGWREGSANLLQGATWALTGDKAPPEEVFLRVADMLELLDSPWVATSPAEHDRALARSSHLIQILQTTLAAAASDWTPLARRLSGPALRDTTRLAESPFDMWQGIVGGNEENIAAVLFAFAEELRSAQLAVLHPDADLRTLWRHGSLGRDQILSARWQEPVWRETSVPRGRWWEELCSRSEEGALFRSPRFDTGLLLLRQA